MPEPIKQAPAIWTVLTLRVGYYPDDDNQRGRELVSDQFLGQLADLVQHFQLRAGLTFQLIEDPDAKTPPSDGPAIQLIA